MMINCICGLGVNQSPPGEYEYPDENETEISPSSKSLMFDSFHRLVVETFIV